jgi:hypothetical protein
MKKIYGLFAFVLLQVVVAGIASKPLRAYWTAKTISAVDGSIVQRKWISSTFPVIWQMNPAQGSNVTGSRQQSDVLNTSFAAWAAVAPVSAKQGANANCPPDQYDGTNCITTTATPGDLPTGILAYTYTFFFTQPGQDNMNRTISFAGQILEADMEFSNTLPGGIVFSLNAVTPANAIDFQSVATHEAGHFFGLDHASDVSSTMFWAQAQGYSYQRNLTTDDIAGISTIYPPANFSSTGTLKGKVKTTSNTPVFGAIVVAVNASGQPIASTLTDPSGNYSIEGLPAGTYTVFAEPLSGRINSGNVSTLTGNLGIYPNLTVNTGFTTRYH